MFKVSRPPYVYLACWLKAKQYYIGECVHSCFTRKNLLPVCDKSCMLTVNYSGHKALNSCVLSNCQPVPT